MDQAEQKMLEEVAIRNAISMFRNLNASSGKKKASIPSVGIFWIDSKGVMYAESVSLRDAEDYGEFKIFEKPHFDAWGIAVSRNPQWRGLEYDAVPRGRVVYRKGPSSGEFIVYLPKQIAKFKAKVVDMFDLPAGHVRWDYSDEHYRMG
jgi:hypothetical protein